MFSFHTGNYPYDARELTWINGNQSEEKIIADTCKAMDACKKGSWFEPHSWSEVAFLAARVWCKENKIGIEVFNWSDGSDISRAIHTFIDENGEIENKKGLFEKKSELFNKLI